MKRQRQVGDRIRNLPIGKKKVHQPEQIAESLHAWVAKMRTKLRAMMHVTEADLTDLGALIDQAEGRTIVYGDARYAEGERQERLF